MRKLIIFLGVLLLTLGLFVGSASAVITTVSDADKTYIEWKSGATVLFKIDDTDGVTIPGGVSASGNFTLTSPVVASNAVYGLINAGSAWAIGGNLVGLRGKVVVTAAGNTGSATGVWAGLQITSASVQRFGLQVGLNVEAYSNTICLPNAVAYLQSLPSGSTTDFSDVPYLVFSETVSGSATGSNILFEVGHSWANTVPTIGTGELFYNHTLQIAVNESAGNRTCFFIPLSTVEGTYTTEYPIATTSTITLTPAANGTYLDFVLETLWVGGTLINADFGSAVTLTSATKGINLDFSAVHVDSDQNITAIDLTFPDLALDTISKAVVGVEISGDTLTQTTSGVSTWTGIDITIPTLVETAGTLTGTGVKISGGTLTTDPISYGVHMSGTFTTGIALTGTYSDAAIDIGTCTSYGILMDDTYVNAIRITTNVATTAQTSVRVLNTYTAASGYHTAIMGAAILDSTAGTGSGAVIGVYGEANIQDTFTGATNWSYGVRGCLQLNDTTDIDNVGSIFGAINAVMKDNPTPTITNAHIAGIYIDNLIDFNLSSANGISAMIYMANNAHATCTMDAAIYLYGPEITNFVQFDDCVEGGMVVDSAASAEDRTGRIKITVQGATRYIYYYD